MISGITNFRELNDFKSIFNDDVTGRSNLLCLFTEDISSRHDLVGIPDHSHHFKLIVENELFLKENTVMELYKSRKKIYTDKAIEKFLSQYEGYYDRFDLGFLKNNNFTNLSGFGIQINKAPIRPEVFLSILLLSKNISTDYPEYSWRIPINEYIAGFKEGFGEFRHTELSEIESLPITDEYKQGIILEIATKNWNNSIGPGMKFWIHENVVKKVMVPDGFTIGKNQGKVYHAWGIILKHYTLFENITKKVTPLNDTSVMRASDISNEIQGDIPIMKPKYFEWVKKSTGQEKEKIIFSALEEQGFIQCNLTQFRKLFSGNPVEEKITWLDKHSSHLVYLIGMLKHKSLIKTDRGHWKQMQNCFEYASINEKGIFSQQKTEDYKYSKKSFFDNLLESVSNADRT